LDDISDDENNMMAKPISKQLLRKIIDENGCFSLIYRRDRHLDRAGGKKIYFYFRPHFVVTMKEDKKELLNQVRDSLGCGKITTGRGQARLDIFSPTDAKVIVDLFSGSKLSNSLDQDEFQLWAEAVRILSRYRKNKVNAEKGKRGFVSVWETIETEDIRRLFRIREEMKKYKKWKKREYRWTNTRLASPFALR